MERASDSELRNRLEALQQERERCEERKVELFKAVNRLKQDLQEGSIDEQRYNDELAKLGPSPQQIIADCNEEIKGIQGQIIECNKQLKSIGKRKKDRVVVAAVLAMLVLLSVGLPFLSVQLTGFLIKEQVTTYAQEISINFTEPQQYLLNISAENVSGELRSLTLSGKLVGEGNAKVYLQKDTARFLVLDTAALQEKGTKGFITITGRAVSDVTEAAAATAAADKNADKKAKKEAEKAAKDAEKEEKKAAEENITAAINETAEANITQPLPQESNLTVNETRQPELPVPVELVQPVEKAINISLAYNAGTVFDSNDDGVELDIFAIDFTVAGSNFSWPADNSKLCTRWVTQSLDNSAETAVCHGSSECCALVELSQHEPSWNEAFYVFVGRDGATYNNSISSQVIFANYSLEPGNVYSEIYYSSFATLPATFVAAPKLENVTEEVPVTNVTVIEFSNLCVETCSLAGIAGLNLSEYTLVVEVENATLALDAATYTLAKAVEIDAEAPVVSILLPKNITYIETLAADEARNTTTLSLNFTVSEPVSQILFSLNGQGNVTIAAGTTSATITAANGTNTLILFAADESGNAGYAVAEFFVNFTTQPALVIDTEPPVINITLPLQNATYNTTAVGLNFTVSEPANVSYFLNLQPKVDTSENVTLNSSEGRNRLLLLATDAAGNVGSTTVIFFVNTSNVTANVTAAEVNITPLLKSKKPHFKLDEDAELEFEYIKKPELVRVGKWKEGYEGYEDDYEEYLETASAAKKAAVEQAVAVEKAKAKRKQVDEWVTANETIVAQVFDSEGRKASIGAEIEEFREGKFGIKLPKQREFRAGLYTLMLSFTKDGAIYTEEQNFTWGVLAINTNKSIFLPNEDAFVAMAVLDDQGHMVCDANVSLAITDPAGATTAMTTSNGTISISPECKVYGVTNMPDYYTNYTVNGTGTYVMNLTAATANGVRTILDNFTVQSSVDFDVARFGPTRIWPFAPYNMSFAIRADKNYNGLITEFVPASFNITPQQGLTVTTIAAANAKAISWNVQLRKGDVINLSYEFDAPDVSPEFYLLGELGIGAWREARQWQVASDVSTITDDSFTIVPTSINVGEIVNMTGQYDATGSGGCGGINLTITEGGTTVTSTSNTAVQLVDIFFIAPCDGENLAGGYVECITWGATSDNIQVNFTVNGTTGGGGSKTYTTAKLSGACAATLDVTDTLTVNAAADTTPPNASIIVPLPNSNFSGSFVVNVSVNDSESSVGRVNLTIYNNTDNVTMLIAMNISTGTNLSGYWNVTFDSTTLRDARYNLSVNATDSAATPNTAISANVSVTIDNTRPNATTLAPANMSNVSGTITVRAGANDTLTGIVNVTFQFRNATNQTTRELATLNTGTIFAGEWTASYNTAQLADGKYNITFNATDFAGNNNMTDLHQNFTVTIDNTIPNGTILSPANATNIRGFFTINASVNDTLTKVQNVSFRLRSPGYEGTLAFAALATGTTDQGVWNASINSSTVANGVYNITLNASDFAGNLLLINTSNVVVNNSGFLNITLNGPKGGRNITQNSTFTVNATVACSNGYCQQVNGTVYYNLTSLSPATRINATALDKPFHNVTTFVNQTCGYLDIDAVCSLNWTINATGDIGSSYFLSINFTSNNSEISQNGTSNFQINITEAAAAENTAPIAFNNSVALNGSVTLSDGGKTQFVVKFNVTDADGVADLNNAAAGVNITFNGIKRSNNSGNCETQNNGANTRLYTCIVVFNYFDNSTTLWDINISAADVAGLVGYNDSQSLGSGAAHNLTVESLSAFSLSTGSVATTANINTQNNELSFVVNNTGNFDFTVLNVTPFNLNASLTDIFALNGNFSINATASTSDGFGENLQNATPRNFTATGDGLGGELSATLPHKITNGEGDNLGNRTLYIYIDVPFGLSTSVTYNSSKAWELFAS